MAELKITIKCRDHDDELDDVVAIDRDGNVTITAAPCPKCLQDEYDRAYEDGGMDAD